MYVYIYIYISSSLLGLRMRAHQRSLHGADTSQPLQLKPHMGHPYACSWRDGTPASA